MASEKPLTSGQVGPKLFPFYIKRIGPAVCLQSAGQYHTRTV